MAGEKGGREDGRGGGGVEGDKVGEWARMERWSEEVNHFEASLDNPPVGKGSSSANERAEVEEKRPLGGDDADVRV